MQKGAFSWLAFDFPIGREVRARVRTKPLERALPNTFVGRKLQDESQLPIFLFPNRLSRAHSPLRRKCLDGKVLPSAKNSVIYPPLPLKREGLAMPNQENSFSDFLLRERYFFFFFGFRRCCCCCCC